MSDAAEAKEVVQEVAQKLQVASMAKKSVWKYFGAMMMEKKDGEYAVSLTRVLALFCFTLLMWKWSGLTGPVDPQVVEVLGKAGLDVPTLLKAAGDIPDTLMYTFWGLLGGKTLESMAALFKGVKS